MAVGTRLSYARSLLITAPLIFLYTGIMASISVASSLLDARGRMQHTCARIWARMILWTSRVRVSVKGVENIRPNVPYVLCVNHQSHMDIPILLAALPFQFRFAAKKQLFRFRFLDGTCAGPATCRSIEKILMRPSNHYTRRRTRSRV